MADLSLPDFMAHLAGFNTRLIVESRRSMEKIAKAVEAEAKHEIGTYQDAAGPFSGWPELADATKEDRAKHGFSENQPGLRTGEMRDSIHHEFDHEAAVVGSDEDKLVWFELGTVKQPPRSVLGVAVVHKEPEIVHELGNHVVTALVGHEVFQGMLKIR